mgnify:CR=1 FL=1
MTEEKNIRKAAREIGAQFSPSADGSGYVSTHGQTHDTFKVDNQGNISDQHSSSDFGGGAKKSRWHEK